MDLYDMTSSFKLLFKATTDWDQLSPMQDIVSQSTLNKKLVQLFRKATALQINKKKSKITQEAEIQ